MSMTLLVDSVTKHVHFFFPSSQFHAYYSALMTIPHVRNPRLKEFEIETDVFISWEQQWKDPARDWPNFRLDGEFERESVTTQQISECCGALTLALRKIDRYKDQIRRFASAGVQTTAVGVAKYGELYKLANQYLQGSLTEAEESLWEKICDKAWSNLDSKIAAKNAVILQSIEQTLLRVMLEEGVHL